MPGLAEATSLVTTEGGFQLELHPAWSGWGPAGGYLAAIALRAAGQIAPPQHRPVTMSCQFLATAKVGAAEAKADVLKQGGSFCANVTLFQEARRFFQAQIWTTSRSSGPDELDARMPDVPRPDALRPIEDYLTPGVSKRVDFWSNLDCKPVEYRAPGRPPPQSKRLQGWFRFREDASSSDVFVNACRAAFLVDVNVWPTHWRTRDVVPPYVAPTLDTTVWFHDVSDVSDWLFVDAVSEIARNGLVHGTVRVWNDNGRPIATGGSQCLVIPSTA